MNRPAPQLAKSELVYRDLRGRIVSGRLEVGSRLVLGQLAREFGVSPVPVREAIRRLEAERLVVFTLNVGAEVAGVDPERYEQVMETLAGLEAMAISLSAAHITAAQLDAAEECNERIRELAGGEVDVAEFNALNRQFHAAMWAGCRNTHLLELLESEWERVQVIRRSTITFVPTNVMLSVEQHGAILALVRQRASADAIGAAVRAHKLRRRRVFSDDRVASASNSF